MRLVMLVTLAVALAGCGRSEPSPAPAPRPPTDEAPPQERLACPTGTTAKQKPWRQQRSENFVMTEGQEEWCERADGKRHGPWRVTYMNHRLGATGAYQDGARTGTWKSWYGERDRPWQAGEETWVDNVRQGAWRSFRPDSGKPWAESTFKNGKLDGEWIEVGEDGKKHVVGTFVAGEPQGEFTKTLLDGTTRTFKPDPANYDPKPIGE